MKQRSLQCYSTRPAKQVAWTIGWRKALQKSPAKQIKSKDSQVKNTTSILDIYFI
jgi:hypothetical protein